MKRKVDKLDTELRRLKNTRFRALPKIPKFKKLRLKVHVQSKAKLNIVKAKKHIKHGSVIKRAVSRLKVRAPSEIKLKGVNAEKQGKPSPEVTSAVSRLKGEYVETSIDGLFDLVEKRGRVTLVFAARALGYPKSEVEDWAKALAEHGLIEINYGMFSTVLKKKSVKK